MPSGDETEITRSASKVWVRLICTPRLAMVPVVGTAAVLVASPKSGMATGLTPLTENGTWPAPQANVQLALQLAGDPSQSSPSSSRPLLQPGITQALVLSAQLAQLSVPPAKPSLTQVAPPKSKPSQSSCRSGSRHHRRGGAPEFEGTARVAVEHAGAEARGDAVRETEVRAIAIFGAFDDHVAATGRQLAEQQQIGRRGAAAEDVLDAPRVLPTGRLVAPVLSGRKVAQPRGLLICRLRGTCPWSRTA